MLRNLGGGCASKNGGSGSISKAPHANNTQLYQIEMPKYPSEPDLKGVNLVEIDKKASL